MQKMNKQQYNGDAYVKENRAKFFVDSACGFLSNESGDSLFCLFVCLLVCFVFHFLVEEGSCKNVKDELAAA